MTNKVEFHGTTYSIGMILAYGSTGGLPDFADVVQIIVVCDSLAFVVKLQTSWYCEHLRLESTSIVKVVGQSKLADTYPLAAYVVEGK